MNINQKTIAVNYCRVTIGEMVQFSYNGKFRRGILHDINHTYKTITVKLGEDHYRQFDIRRIFELTIKTADIMG
jgi:hypothetical protein